jgi:tRNA (guanine-N7-)-methyltransferase
MRFIMPSKLEKFDQIDTFPNCTGLSYQNAFKDNFELKGKWRSDFFKNDKPIVLELGCGRGEYTVGLAQRYPDKNFLGVDIKGNRIWYGAKYALDHGMDNIGFLRTRIDFIDKCFSTNEIDEIWITFPDPQPQKPRERKRLTNLMFLNRYFQFLKPNGIIHLKTDSEPFYNYSKEVAEGLNMTIHYATNDLYKNCPENRPELMEIKTYYEGLFTAKGFNICYLMYKRKL